MVTKKNIDETDLYKLKSEITKEQQDARHQQNNNIQDLSLCVDEIKTKNSLFEHIADTMKEDIKEIKEIVKEWFKTIEDKYVTKATHNETKNRIDTLYKVLYWLVWFVFSILIWTILAKIWLWK